MIEDLSIYTKDTGYDNLDFCSFDCFVKYFNKTMGQENTGVELSIG
jgi:hypothetical protein